MFRRELERAVRFLIERLDVGNITGLVRVVGRAAWMTLTAGMSDSSKNNLARALATCQCAAR